MGMGASGRCARLVLPQVELLQGRALAEGTQRGYSASARAGAAGGLAAAGGAGGRGCGAPVDGEGQHLDVGHARYHLVLGGLRM